MKKPSIREVSRIIVHHRNTISKYNRLIVEHAEKLTDHYLREISPGDTEVDEIWSFVQKKRKISKRMILKNLETTESIRV